MAGMTQAHKVTVCESKFRIISIVLDVVYLGSLPPYAVPFAILALVFVTAQDVSAFLSPCS
jgi:hypothetical protein